MIHDLKIQPIHFQAIADGRKRFEIRSIADRSFDEGDMLHLREWDEDHYTGREMGVRVSLVHSGLGVAPGHVVMSIETLEDHLACTLDPMHPYATAALAFKGSKYKTFTNPALGEPWPEGSIGAKIDQLGRDMGKIIQSLESDLVKVVGRVDLLETRTSDADPDDLADMLKSHETRLNKLEKPEPRPVALSGRLVSVEAGTLAHLKRRAETAEARVRWLEEWRLKASSVAGADVSAAVTGFRHIADALEALGEAAKEGSAEA